MTPESLFHDEYSDYEQRNVGLSLFERSLSVLRNNKAFQQKLLDNNVDDINNIYKMGSLRTKFTDREADYSIEIRRGERSGSIRIVRSGWTQDLLAEIININVEYRGREVGETSFLYWICPRGLVDNVIYGNDKDSAYHISNLLQDLEHNGLVSTQCNKSAVQ